MTPRPFKSSYSRLLALWILRAFAPGLGQSSFLAGSNYTDPDIAKDILTPSPRDRGVANTHKGWFNQLLENNRQPVFWISNKIESFPGIMIASTNLIDQLDPASLRRFDIKLHFDYLRPEQAACLLESYCKNLKLPPPTPADLILATDMQVSTPGDFAAVARQHKFQPFRDASGLLEAVISELAHKGAHHRRIGFQ